jgi:fibronectin type 3 domain-containing protein
VSNATGSPASIPVSGTGVASVQHTVALSWNASTSATGYNVYRSATSGSGYARVNSGVDGSLSYGDTSVQNGQTYYYVTTAVDASGQESAYSTEVSAVIP